MTASSTIIIDAEDKASAKILNAAANVDKSVKKIKDVSQKAKASTEFFGVLARSLGGTELGGVASELAGMTEKVSQFAEVSKAGRAGALAFKAGLAGLVGTVAIGIGKAIGDVVFETDKWTNSLAEARKESERLNAAINAQRVSEFSDALERAKLFPDAEKREAELGKLLKNTERDVDMLARRLEASKVEAEEWADAWFKFGDRAAFAEDAKRQVEVNREALEVAKENLQAIRDETGERAKAIAQQEKQLEKAKELEAFSESISKANQARAAAAINTEVQLTQTLEERRIAIEQGTEAARAYALEVGGLESQTAKRIAAEEAAIELAQKTAEIKKQEADKERERVKQIADLQREEIKRLELKRLEILKGADAAKVAALQQQGLSKAIAERLVAEEKALDRVQEERDKRREAATQLAGVQTGVQAVESRLQTRGQAERGIDRVARGVEKQVKILQEIRDKEVPQPRPGVQLVEVR